MDQLGIPLKGNVHELKIGSSFSSKKPSPDSPAFHAFRYDFKPVSIDSSKPSTVTVRVRRSLIFESCLLFHFKFRLELLRSGVRSNVYGDFPLGMLRHSVNANIIILSAQLVIFSLRFPSPRLGSAMKSTP